MGIYKKDFSGVGITKKNIFPKLQAKIAQESNMAAISKPFIAFKIWQKSQRLNPHVPFVETHPRKVYKLRFRTFSYVVLSGRYIEVVFRHRDLKFFA